MTARRVRVWSRWLPAVLLAWLALPSGAEALPGLRLLDEATGPTYRVTAVVPAGAAALAEGREGELRLVFDYAAPDHYRYVLLRDGQAQFHQVRHGVDQPLGTPGPLYGLATGTLRLALQRGEWAMTLTGNEVVAARAEAPRDAELDEGGDVGYAVQGAGLALDELLVQPTEDIWYADDFMRADEEQGAWETLSGRWENNQQGSRSERSANAFSYRNVGADPALTVTGHPFWSDYVAQVAVRADGRGALGLAVGVVDADHLFRLRWTSERASDGGTCRLQRVFGGQVTDLTPSLPRGYRPGVWYKLQLALAGGWLYAWIDDEPLFEVAVQCFPAGRVGLWVEPSPEDQGDQRSALFDDLVVRSWPLFVEGFDTPAAGRWHTPDGQALAAAGWRLGAGDEAVAVAPPNGSLWTGSPDWRDATVDVDLRTESGWVGLVLNAGEAGYHVARVGRDRAELVRMAPGEPMVLHTVAHGLGDAAWHHLQASVDRGLIRVTLDEQPLLEGFDLSLSSGQVGLWTGGAREAAFDNLRVRLRPNFWRLPPVLPAEFVSDRYMTDWAGPGAAWFTVPGSETLWHKGLFFGDRRVSFTIPGYGRRAGQMAIIIGAEATEPDLGYRLELALPDDAAQPLRLTLRHGEAVLAEAEAAVTSDEPTVEFELRGRFLVVWIDGEAALSQAIDAAVEEQP